MEGMATSFGEDNHGIIWLATSKHLYVYNGKEVSVAKEFPFDFNVRKIVKINSNKLVFAR